MFPGWLFLGVLAGNAAIICELNSEWAKKEILSGFNKNSLATLEFVLRWSDGRAEHEERYLARRVNVWRDIFPPGLVERLEGKVQGESVVCEYGVGTLVPGHSERNLAELPLEAFIPRTLNGREILPRIGRFYPLGMLRVRDAFPQSLAPFRILGMADGRMTVDRNHPLARYPLTLEARLVEVRDKRSETGGALYHWMEEMCDYGPGMQAEIPGRNTDFFHPGFFLRADEEPDSRFYAEPRIISHVDEGAGRNLRDFQSRFLKPGMRVLDLMSSVRSQLPDDLGLEVAGLGLNMREMEENSILSRRVVHDLNADPAIPDSLGEFEAVACGLSVEYLTDPVAVFRSVFDRIRPGGTVMVGMSDRWFPTKAVAGWMDLHPFERSGMVLEVLRRAGFHGPCGTFSKRNDWRPVDDPHYLETRGVGDPVYVVWARKS